LERAAALAEVICFSVRQAILAESYIGYIVAGRLPVEVACGDGNDNEPGRWHREHHGFRPCVSSTICSKNKKSFWNSSDKVLVTFCFGLVENGCSLFDDHREGLHATAILCSCADHHLGPDLKPHRNRTIDDLLRYGTIDRKPGDGDCGWMIQRCWQLPYAFSATKRGHRHSHHHHPNDDSVHLTLPIQEEVGTFELCDTRRERHLRVGRVA
jgi:hypothetical protein